MKNDQLQKNWDAFERLSDEVKAQNVGRSALLHDGELVDIYNDSGDAYKIGCEKFGLGNFSTEIFGANPISLGFFTPCIRAEGAGAVK